MGACPAAIGTVAVMLLVEAAVIMAFTSPKNTLLFAKVELKLLPAIITLAPIGAKGGDIEVIVGGMPNTNPGLVPVPKLFVTATAPDAPAPTVAVMDVAEFTIKLEAETPPKLTLVVPIKLLPVIVTNVEALPNTGLKESMKGDAFTSFK